MSTLVTYDIADTASNRVHHAALTHEVLNETDITAILESIVVEELTVVLSFDRALTGGETTALDALVAAHTGVFVPQTIYNFVASSSLVESTRAITDTNFEVLSGVVTNVSEFATELSKVKGRVRGSAKVAGSGAELRLVEEGSPDEVMHSGAWSLADTSGAWVTFEFLTTQAPDAGTNTFRLEGKRGAATLFEVRFVSLSLLLQGP